MVGAAGLEPATLCLEGKCSIHLSYAPPSVCGVDQAHDNKAPNGTTSHRRIGPPSYIGGVLFLVARDLSVTAEDDLGRPATPVTIPAGETVRLIPEFAAAPIAHLAWNGQKFSCDRSVFLSSSSPIGRAPD